MRMIDLGNRATSLALAVFIAVGCGESGAPSSPVSPTSPTPTDPAPDSRDKIAFYGIAGGFGGLHVINSDGSGAVTVASPGWSPAWSPDGTRLAFSTTQCETDWETYYRCDRGGLAIMDFATRETLTPAGGAIGEDPAWSPKDDLIAFVRYDEGKGRRLFVMRPDGSELRVITTPGHPEVFGPAWSPDGRRLAYTNLLSGIWVINIDGTGAANLAGGNTPSWSPDGTRIAFAAGSSGKAIIATMSPDGSGLVELAEGRGPAWSPDGTQLAFSRNNEGLFTMSRDGSNLKQITRGIHNNPAWKPR